MLIFSAAVCRLEAADDPVLIRFHGSSSAVDINDLVNIKTDKLTEVDVKRICAEITDRYHERGYTAFYIKRAELNKDGTADLFFQEAVVSEIVLTGVSARSDEISASIFTIGELFNEYTLKKNITETKNNFNIKKLNVSISRGKGEHIVLTALAVEKINVLETGIFSSPVYGILPELKYRINYGGFLAGVTFSSSFSQRERSYSSGSVYFNSDSNPGNSYFTISADATDKKESFSEDYELIYMHKSLTTKGGYCYNNGASWINFFITGTADELEDYPGEDGGFSFSGLQLKLNYDNSPYKIDYSEITSGEIDFSAGWNFIEERMSSKLMLNYLCNIPLNYGFFFSLNGNSFYTSDNERFSHFYLYDRLFPCKGDDYSSASWRVVTGADIAYEAMRDTVYILPGFKWGLHNAEDEKNDVYAAALKLLYNAESVKIELSYSYDIKLHIRDGFFMFSAGAVY
jgi:hypothetical protein